jgi:hypothetical protein
MVERAREAGRTGRVGKEVVVPRAIGAALARMDIGQEEKR